MAFETPRSASDYPPAAFCGKYEKFLAPHGLLLPPKQVLRNKRLGEGAEKNLRKAFKITVAKLKKMKDSCAECGQRAESSMECGGCRVAQYCGDFCRQRRTGTHQLVCHLLRQEAVDQLVECLPCPVTVGRESLQGRGGVVLSWSDFLDRHSSFRCNVRSAASVVSQWWEFTGTKHPGDAAIQATLERLVTNIFSTVLTISHSLLWLRQPGLFSAPATSSSDSVPPPSICSSTLDQTLLLQSLNNGGSGKDIHIHLLGADKPEVSMVESGLVQMCSRVLLGYTVHLTLVAPDLSRHPHTLALSPAAPMKVAADLTVGCYPGLYHSFWEDHISTDDPKRKVPRPDVAVAIHPGCHTPEMWALWKPTFLLLAQHKVPLFLTTYNLAEYEETLKVLQELQPAVLLSGPNPLGSLQTKQTPYEPDHVWAANAYGIGIANNDVTSDVARTASASPTTDVTSDVVRTASALTITDVTSDVARTASASPTTNVTSDVTRTASASPTTDVTSDVARTASASPTTDVTSDVARTVSASSTTDVTSDVVRTASALAITDVTLDVTRKASPTTDVPLDVTRTALPTSHVRQT